jgi:ParB-like chromosome segregation protein Spo0J
MATDSENCAMPTNEENVNIELFEEARTDVVEAVTPHIALLASLPLEERVTAINAIREMIHEVSPFNTEPVDFVKWVKNPQVHANDYNPNSVAPPEMELLKTSITADGYTQPIVSMADPDGSYEVIDGFHRHRVGKEDEQIQSRVHGYLPLVQIRESQHDKNDRMAATIRHNRARGKHKVEAMSEIVVELKRRFWSDDKIAKELGMEADEVLRLQQITGLAGLFADRDFSEAWEAESFTGEPDAEQISEED